MLMTLARSKERGCEVIKVEGGGKRKEIIVRHETASSNGKVNHDAFSQTGTRNIPSRNRINPSESLLVRTGKLRKGEDDEYLCGKLIL